MSILAPDAAADARQARPAVTGARRRAALGAERALVGFHQRRFLVVAILSIIFSFDLLRPTDIDLWWHLKTGELIARTGAVPVVDPYSYTAAGQPWVVHEWLWEVATYVLTRLGGYRLAVVASAAVVTLTYALGYRLLRRLGVNEVVAAGLVLWSAVVALPSVGVRPRELTLLFLALYLNRLWLYRSGQVATLRALPLAMLVWVNLHGQFVLGLVVFGAFLLDALFVWRFQSGAFPRHLLIVGLATLAATAVNPLGPRVLLYPFGYYLQRANPSFATVTEFQSPDFHDPLYLVFAAGLALLMVLRPSGRRFDLAEALLVVAFALQALVSVRNLPVCALVVAPVLAARLRDQGAVFRALPPLPRSPTRALLNWAFLLGLAGMAWWSTGQPAVSSRLQLGMSPRDDSLPVGGVAYIDRENLPGPIFNEQSWGGYLIYRWYPERRVFVDGRVDMYGPSIIKDYMDVAELKPDWRQILDRFGIRTILIEKDSPLSTLLLADGGWRRVYRGQVEDVFVRQ